MEEAETKEEKEDAGLPPASTPWGGTPPDGCCEREYPNGGWLGVVLWRNGNLHISTLENFQEREYVTTGEWSHFLLPYTIHTHSLYIHVESL